MRQAFRYVTPEDKAKYPIFAVTDGIWRDIQETHCDSASYLRAVAARLGLVLAAGNANAILADLPHRPGWQPLGHAPETAALRAAQGYFTVAGRTDEHGGHAAVIVPGWSSRHCPMAYWGMQHGGAGGVNNSLSWAWPNATSWQKPAPAPLDEVQYFTHELATLAPTGQG